MKHLTYPGGVVPFRRRHMLIACTLLALSLTVAACSANPFAPSTPALPGSSETGARQGPAPAPSAPGTDRTPVANSSTGASPFVVYSAGNLPQGWTDASYRGPNEDMHFDMQNTELQRDGHPTVKVAYDCNTHCAFSVANWDGSNGVAAVQFTHLHFWINGGTTGGQQIGVKLNDFDSVLLNQYVAGSIPANKWQEVSIPLEDLGASGSTIKRITFSDAIGQPQPAYYLDGIEFVKEQTASVSPTVTPVQITVDVAAKRHSISPYIYGMSNAPDEVMREANLTLNRLGGNSASRYNWVLGNATNRGSDFEYANASLSDDPAAKKPSGLADLIVRQDKSAGIETLLTVPMIGYVAKDDKNSTRSQGVPQEGAGPVAPGSDAIQGYDPSPNQQITSIQSFARKGKPFQDPPAPNAGAVYQDEWIAHLTNTFGKAADGGVRFYSMDNEPDLWADSTHVDVHPVRLGYDDLFKLFTDYATAVKAVDPTAQVTGPVISGWTGYWYSALDRGNDNFATAADRKAHGLPLIPWFLDQVHKHDTSTGQRTLDVLDIHFYPQAEGVNSGKADPKNAALRLRSTRSLWDPSYTDESWIANTADPPNIELIPRMKDWINQYYPGTKLGISEWRWYAEGTMNGALAIADVLGIYGREGVYLACYWDDLYDVPLTSGMPGLEAFKMYRNFDGHNGTFGDVSVAATTATDPDKLSVYASEDSHTKQLKIMVLNKTRQEQMDSQIALQGGEFRGPGHVYQLGDNTGREIQALPDVALNGPSLSVSFPPYSVTLLVVDRAQ